MTARIARLTTLLLIALFLVSACAIEESDKDPVGAISVTAIDTSQGTPLTAGRVLVDGVPRAQRLPALVSGLTAGSYEVEVRPEGIYPAQSFTTVVNPPDTSQVFAQFNTPDTAQVQINTDDDATIIVDEAYASAEPNSPFFISPGIHEFSVWKNGFLTVTPALVVSEEMEPGGSYMYTLTLESGTIGNSLDEIAPEFTLPDPDGNEYSLGELRGHVVLVNFWFVNCQPCREEFPSIEQVYDEYAGDGFRILAVNTGWYTTDTDEAIADFKSQFNLSFPLLVNQDQQEITNTVYQVTSAPTNFLIDETGVIQYRFGSTTYEDLTTKLESMLP
ncbi:TlpA family protein disulfide reductase [bacterium]|nr:TlpA family protein disulfide reductase [bacterium]